jgi:RNA polymerase sigma factor for flagellar operon FliA
VLVDAQLGADGAFSALAREAHDVLIVTRVAAQAITEAYACMKRLHFAHAVAQFRVLTNHVGSHADAKTAFDNLAGVASRYLTVSIADAGCVSADPLVEHARELMHTAVDAFPSSVAARDYRQIAGDLLYWPMRPRPAPAAPCTGAASRLTRPVRRTPRERHRKERAMMYNAQGKMTQADVLAQYAPLVRRLGLQLVAKMPASVDLDDLIQAGMIGLMDAAGRYKEDQGAQFETYATQRIRGAMLDELRSNDWLPRSLRKTSREVEHAVHQVEQQLGRSASEAEIAQHLKMPLDEYQEMLQDLHGSQLIYYEDFDRAADDEPFLDRYRVDHADPLSALLDDHLRGALVDAIDRLPEREKLLMSLYYERGLNLREIGAVLEVSESRVCQLHSQAVARLRAAARAGVGRRGELSGSGGRRARRRRACRRPPNPHFSPRFATILPFSEERCDGPPVSARLGKLHQAAVRRNSRRLRFLNGAHVTNF